jgi:hypothetical protein
MIVRWLCIVIGSFVVLDRLLLLLGFLILLFFIGIGRLIVCLFVVVLLFTFVGFLYFVFFHWILCALMIFLCNGCLMLLLIFGNVLLLSFVEQNGWLSLIVGICLLHKEVVGKCLEYPLFLELFRNDWFGYVGIIVGYWINLVLFFVKEFSYIFMIDSIIINAEWLYSFVFLFLFVIDP